MVLFVSFRVFRWHKAFWNWNVSIHWRNQVIFRLTTMHTHTHSLVNKRIDTPHSSPYHIHTEEHMSGSFAFFGLCSVVAVGVNGMIFLFAKKRCRYFICLCWLANTRLYGSVFMIVYMYFDELFLRTGNQAAVFLGLVGNFFLTCPTKELITNEFYLKIPKPLQGTRLPNRVCSTWQCFLNYCIWPESDKSKHNPINTMSLTAEMLVRFEIRFEKKHTIRIYLQ